MPHGRRTWICMRHYQSKPKSISGEFIRQKTPSNLTTTTTTTKKKTWGLGVSFFSKAKIQKLFSYERGWTHPTWFSPHSTSTSMSMTVTRAYWVTSERGHKRKVSSCPEIRKWCLPVLPPIQDIEQRGSWLLQRRTGQKTLPCALGSTRSPHIMIYNKNRAGAAELGVK